MNLPKPIADLVAAQDKYDSKAFAENFADDATVYDEKKTYSGKKEIQEWNEETNKKYKTKYGPLDISTNGDESVLSIEISGTFPGSPIVLKYYFTIKGDKISSLRIE